MPSRSRKIARFCFSCSEYLPSACVESVENAGQNIRCLAVLAQRVVDQRLVVAQFQRVLHLRLRLLQRRQRLVVVALAALDLGDADLRLRVRRVRRHQPVERLKRLIQLAVHQQCSRQPALGIGIVRVDLQRAAIGRRGLLRLLQLVVAGRQSELDPRRPVCHRHRRESVDRALRVPLLAVQRRHPQHNLLGVGIDLLRGLELCLRLGGVVVERVELAQQQLGLQVGRLQARDGLVLGDRQLQHLTSLRALHVAQRTQIHLPQKRVRRHIVRVLLQLVLGGAYRVLDAPDLEVEIGQAVLQQRRVWIGVQRQLVLLHGLGRVVRTTGADRHLLVEMRQPVVVVRACAVGLRLALVRWSLRFSGL